MQSALRIDQVVEPYIRGARDPSSRRGPRWSSSRPVPATRSSPPTPPRRCVVPRSARRSLKATKVDGVYTADPKKDPRGTALPSHQLRRGDRAQPEGDGLDRRSRLCRDQKLPINVFSIFKARARSGVVMGEDEGTLVHSLTSGGRLHDFRTQEEHRAEDAEVGRGAQDRPRQGAYRARPPACSTT